MIPRLISCSPSYEDRMLLNPRGRLLKSDFIDRSRGYSSQLYGRNLAYDEEPNI